MDQLVIYFFIIDKLENIENSKDKEIQNSSTPIIDSKKDKETNKTDLTPKSKEASFSSLSTINEGI